MEVKARPPTWPTLRFEFWTQWLENHSRHICVRAPDPKRMEKVYGMAFPGVGLGGDFSFTPLSVSGECSCPVQKLKTKKT